MLLIEEELFRTWFGGDRFEVGIMRCIVDYMNELSGGGVVEE